MFIEHPANLHNVDQVTITGNGNSFLRLGSLTTAQKTALTAENGMMSYVSTTNSLDAYINGAWGSVLTDAANIDIGAHDFRARNVTADALTAGRLVYTGANGLLSEEAALAWTTASSRLDITKTAIGVTQGDYGLKLINTTAAAAGAQQYSPPSIWQGQGWETDGTSSMAVAFRTFVRPIEGAAAPTGALDFQVSINGGAYSDLLTVLSNGNVGIGTTTPLSKLFVYSGTGGGSVPTADDIICSESAVSAYFNMISEVNKSCGLLFSDDVRGRGYVLYNHTADRLELAAAATVSLYIVGGNVGIATAVPGQILDVNSGSGNMIADGYDSHPSIYAFKENAVALTGAGMIDKLKSFKLFEFTRKPYVSADELRTATIKHFSQSRWVAAFGGEIVEDEGGVKTIQGDEYRNGALYTCPDEGMLAFIDTHAEKLREERRPLPEWTRKHLGPILDDPGTKEALGDVIHYDEEGNITGYSLNDQVGFLEGVIRELVDRIEVLEAA